MLDNYKSNEHYADYFIFRIIPDEYYFGGDPRFKEIFDDFISNITSRTHNNFCLFDLNRVYATYIAYDKAIDIVAHALYNTYGIGMKWSLLKDYLKACDVLFHEKQEMVFNEKLQKLYQEEFEQFVDKKKKEETYKLKKKNKKDKNKNKKQTNYKLSKEEIDTLLCLKASGETYDACLSYLNSLGIDVSKSYMYREMRDAKYKQDKEIKKQKETKEPIKDLPF